MTPDLPGPLDALTADRRVAADRDASGASGARATPTAADGSLIAVDGVSLSYGDVAVLSEVSLSVEAGEFVGLVGPNGAGKTTLLKAINGVLAPDSGRVRVGEETVAALSSRAASRLVATVPQDTTVAFEFAVEDVVEMGRTPYHGRLRGDPDAGEAVERALERTETARFRDRSIASLSGGERQRVVLARALAQETPALLLDEPTASLDVNHQVRTLKLVRDLVDAEGKAALAAIHDLDLAARFCDIIAVLADGDLLAVGPPEEVLTAERVGAAFDADAAVLPNPVTGTPTVTPLTEPGDCDLRIHVVGTGAATARAVAALAAAGATVTVGAVPAGDVAAEAAAELADEAVTAPAFAALDAEVEAAARDLLSAADAAVAVAPLPASLRALVRDHPTLVRVAGESPDAAGEGAAGPVGSAGDDAGVPDQDADDGAAVPDPDAAATPATLVSAIEGALDRPVEADD